MTQTVYGYPQQPGYPDPNAGQYGAPQGYVQAPPPYQQPAPPQQYPVHNPNVPHNPGAYGPPPGYGQAPAGPPQQDLSGDLESFYAQRSVGGGKGISWKGVPDGYTIQGVVARPITNGDVFKETHPPNSPQAGQIRTNRDGSPKYAMQVPLKLFILDQFQARDYPEGEARLFLRGQLRDEMTRAMAEVGAPEGPPEAGAFVRVTLTHRKPSQNIAQNIFAVLYRSPGTWEQDPNLTNPNAQQFTQPPAQPAPAGQAYAGAPNQGPYQGQATAYAAAPAQPAPNPQQYAQPQAPAQGAPQYGGQAYAPNPQQAAQFGGPVPGFQGQPAQSGQFQAQAQPAQQADPNQASNWIANPNPQQPTPQQQYAGGTGSAEYGAPQAPAGNLPPQGPPPNQPPVQAGVQQSALDPARQALLARLQGGQAAPQGNPQQPQG